MNDLCRLVWLRVRLFHSRTALQAEILVLRHQLNVLSRKVSKRFSGREALSQVRQLKI
jgi:hypothetical protein